jgi:hypothetical protein
MHVMVGKQNNMRIGARIVTNSLHANEFVP